MQQMEKYRRKLNEQSATPARLEAIAPHAKTSLGYVNLGLPSHLTLDDDNELNWADNNVDTQSVDQEYSAYTFGTLAKLDTDLLKFWEVCDPSIFDS
jgi:hypothetical protein